MTEDFAGPGPDAIAKEADRRMLHGALARLAATGSPLLRSIADDVRAGRLTLTELARRPEVAEPFTAALNRYQMWSKGLTAREREMLLEEMDKRVRQVRAQIAEEWAGEEGGGVGTSG